jgi:hypothetical protein
MSVNHSTPIEQQAKREHMETGASEAGFQSQIIKCDSQSINGGTTPSQCGKHSKSCNIVASSFHNLYSSLSQGSYICDKIVSY